VQEIAEKQEIQAEIARGKTGKFAILTDIFGFEEGDWFNELQFIIEAAALWCSAKPL
jgi:hypothetical protein